MLWIVLTGLLLTAFLFYFLCKNDDEIAYFIYKEVDAIPFKKHYDDAGWDLKSMEHVVINPGEYKAIDTGLIVAIPEGYFGHILPRSGLALKHGIMTMAGVIDSGYRDTIKVLLYNAGKEPLEVKPGDRIAQLVIQKISLRAETLWIKDAQEEGILETERGEQGFGSTGISS